MKTNDVLTKSVLFRYGVLVVKYFLGHGPSNMVFAGPERRYEMQVYLVGVSKEIFEQYLEALWCMMNAPLYTFARSSVQLSYLFSRIDIWRQESSKSKFCLGLTINYPKLVSDWTTSILQAWSFKYYFCIQENLPQIIQTIQPASTSSSIISLS